MTDPDTVPADAYSALDRLYDDPDEQIVALTAQTPPEDEIATQKTVFKALANGSRLRVLAALRDGERCVCELQAILDAPQSTVATHLRKLRQAGLLNARKDGKWTYYRIADTAAFQLLDLAAAIETEA